MWKDFKKFVMRGNVLNLAVGVIIGGAFNSIVSSLVNDILNPIIGIIIGKVDLTSLVIQIGQTPIAIGNFLQSIINFLIMAFTIFIIVKGISKLERKKEEAPAAPASPSKEEQLLTEIRDLLKEKK